VTAGPDVEATAATAGEPRRRLHPLSPLLRGGRLAVLAVAAISWRGLQDLGVQRWLFAVAVIGLLTLVVSAVSWAFTGYHVVGRELRVYEGLLWRRTRAILLERLQSVELIRPLLARLTGLAELRLEVVGAHRTEAPLAFLRVQEAADLRTRLLAVRTAAGPLPGTTAGFDPWGKSAGPGEWERSHPPGLARAEPAQVLIAVGNRSWWCRSCCGALVAHPGGDPGPGVLPGHGARPQPDHAGQHGHRDARRRAAADPGDHGGLAVHRRGRTGRPARAPRPHRDPHPDRAARPDPGRDGHLAAALAPGGLGPGGHGHRRRADPARAVRRTGRLLPVGTVDDAQRVLGVALPGSVLRGVVVAPCRPGPTCSRRYGRPGWATSSTRPCSPPARAYWTRELRLVPYARMQSVRIRQGPLQRLLRLASVWVDCAGDGVVAVAPHRDAREARALATALADRARWARGRRTGEP
jgi:putative membrane protein